MTTEQLVTEIVGGMQDKKAKRIISVCLKEVEAACEYFVICEGDSATQNAAIALSVRDSVRKKLGEKPLAIDGLNAASWIALDYGQAIVHIFQRELRDFYDIEHLWADARIEEIPNIDE